MLSTNKYRTINQVSAYQTDYSISQNKSERNSAYNGQSRSSYYHTSMLLNENTHQSLSTSRSSHDPSTRLTIVSSSHSSHWL